MKYNLLIIIIILTLISCKKPEYNPVGMGRTSSCWAFDHAKIKVWMPYEYKNRYKYIDSNGNEKYLSIDSTYGNKAYSSKVIGLGGCSIIGSVYSFANLNDSTKIDMSVTYTLNTADPLGAHLIIKWMGLNFSFKNYNPDAEELILETVGAVILSVKDKMIFGSKSYYNVHELTFKKFPNFNPNELQKLYLVKGEGIVAYITRDNVTYWMNK